MGLVPHFDNVDRSSLRRAFPKVEAQFRDFFEKFPVPGLAYGIVVDGALIHANGMGIQNVVTQQPVTPDSVFRIASMTKSFTAMAVVKLRDEGKLRLDDLAEQHVPELAALPYPTRDSAPITVRQLLTMSAGFPQDDPWADRQLAIPEAQLSAWLQSGISFSNPPGVKYEYSNYGYAILGRIVTNLSGVPYSTYVTENILKPLGMISSTFDIHAVAPERLAMGYRREGDQWIEETPLEDGAFAALGGLFTTVTDFARYMAFLLAAFPPRDDADTGPVKRSSVREMQQPWRLRLVTSSRQSPDVPAVFTGEGYGYGLTSGIDSLLGYSVAHGGGLPGYGTFYRILPDCNVGIVALTNRTYASPAPRVTDALVLLQKTGGMPPRTIPATPALLELQSAVTALYEQWDDAKLTTLTTASFFQDAPLDKRRQQVEQLRASLGKCRSTTAIEPENALRGRWRMDCQRGHIEVWVTMAPTVPPRMQVLQFTAAHKLNHTLKHVAADIARLIAQWDDEQAKTLLSKSVPRKRFRAQCEALRVQYGKLRLGEVLESDGHTQARLRLLGERGMVDMKLILKAKSGKVREVIFTRPRETNFVP